MLLGFSVCPCSALDSATMGNCHRLTAVAAEVDEKEKEKKKDEPGSYEAVCSADPKPWTFDAAFPMPPRAAAARS